MKAVVSIMTMLCFIVPAMGQSDDPSNIDPTVVALKALVPLHERARFGSYMKSNHSQAEFATFLIMQGRFSLLADKKMLLRVKFAADHPNYRGNANAKITNNLWRAIIDGRVPSYLIKPDKTMD